jgi:hypothetical protein
MSSEHPNNRPQPGARITPSMRHSHRFAGAQLADQQVEAATRELLERFEAAEGHQGDRRAAGEAIRYAWSILTAVGLSDFDAIRSIRTEEYPDTFPSNQHALISLSLEIVGWYQFGLRPYDIDRTARIFDRCLELTPQNQRALEKFAIVANTIQPENIGGLSRFPKKQRETALGYRLQCKRKIDNLLLDVFAITEAHLVGQTETSVATLIRARKERDRSFLFNILGHLSAINCAVGDFFGNGVQLSLGIGAACCQLEMLGLPRDLTHLITLLRSRLDEGSSGEVAGEETDIVCEIMTSVANLCDSKWRVFKNHASQRRARELRSLIEEIEARRGDAG